MALSLSITFQNVPKAVLLGPEYAVGPNKQEIRIFITMKQVRGQNKRGGSEEWSNRATSKNTKSPDYHNSKRMLFGILPNISLFG